MRRFSFRLEKILKLRKYYEEEAKNELGQAIGILTGIENNIKINAAQHSQAVTERFSGINAAGIAGPGAPDSCSSSDAFGARSMLAWDSYIHRLEQEAESLADEAARAEQVVEEKRNLYLAASRDLKIMEKLQEKRIAEHRKEMFAAETKELDERRMTNT
jgi:flagellar FliJ protein